MSLALRGKGVVPGSCRGEALVSRMPISFLGGVDARTGLVVERGHDLEGKCVSGKILCFPHGKGSTVGSYVLLALKKRGLAPLAIVNEVADQIVVVGAILAQVPMVVGVDIGLISTGDLVEVDGSTGVVKVLRRASRGQ